MNQQDVLNKRIFLATSKIYEEFPELIKYLDEIPAHVSTAPGQGSDNSGLIEYLNTLNKLLETYHQKNI
ncbi:MAG: hypothetical protein ACI9AT_000105 [Ulvibacter sp.]|jgi:hypothetical protein